MRRPALLDNEDHAAFAEALRGAYGGTLVDRHALRRQPFQEHRHELGVVPAERRCGFHDGDVAAEAAVRLRHFHADRTAADDQEAFGPAIELEQRLVGQVGHVGKAGNRRHRGRRAGGDDEAARPDRQLAGNHRAGIDEGGALPDDPHAHGGEAFGRIVGRDPIDDGAHMGMDLAEIRRTGARVYSEGRRLAGRMRMPRRRDQGLGGHAAGVEALPAHLAAFDQHDRHAEGGRRGGHRQPRGAGANDADVGRDGFGHEAGSRSVAAGRRFDSRQVGRTPCDPSV